MSTDHTEINTPAQPEEFYPPVTISEANSLFEQGQRQAKAPETNSPTVYQDSKFLCPYPEESPQSRWWVRGYDSERFYQWAVEAKLEACRRNILIKDFADFMQDNDATQQWTVITEWSSCDSDPLESFVSDVELDGKNGLTSIIPGFNLEKLEEYLEYIGCSLEDYEDEQIWTYITDELKLTGLLSEVWISIRENITEHSYTTGGMYRVKYVYAPTEAELIIKTRAIVEEIVKSFYDTKTVTSED